MGEEETSYDRESAQERWDTMEELAMVIALRSKMSVRNVHSGIRCFLSDVPEWETRVVNGFNVLGNPDFVLDYHGPVFGYAPSRDYPSYWTVEPV